MGFNRMFSSLCSDIDSAEPRLQNYRLTTKLFLSAALICLSPAGIAGQDPLTLPLISIADIERAFQGAFKVEYRSPADQADDSLSLRSSYANGRIAYNAARQSVFIDSHVYADAIGEFKVPGQLSRSPNTDNLPNAQVLQDYSPIIDRANTPNDERINELGGMALLGDELFVQVYDYYDAPARDTHTTLVVRDASRVATSQVDGFFDLAGAGKTLNYLSPIPKQWQALLGGDYLAGNGGGVPINSRLSIGPSLFAFKSKDFAAKASGDIQSKEWLSYDLRKPLSTTAGKWDSYNDIGLTTNFAQSNRLWTQSSAAWFGFIPAGTRTFVVLGQSGMHNSGGGYKITQTNGNLCGGPCPYDAHDSSPYYWLYDMKDVVSAKQSDTLLPYAYGEFNSRYEQKGYKGITGGVSGGAYDPKSGQLFLLLKSATKSSNAGSPVVSVYQLTPQSVGNAVMVPMIELLMED